MSQPFDDAWEFRTCSKCGAGGMQAKFTVEAGDAFDPPTEWLQLTCGKCGADQGTMETKDAASAEPS